MRTLGTFPILFIKAIKHQSGYALYGNPPRWHKVAADKPAPGHAHHVALSHYQVAAFKKLHASGALQGLAPNEQSAKIKGVAAEMQAAASASAAVSGWKKAVLAGQNPTPAQSKAFHALPDAKRQELLDLVQKQAGKPAVAAAAPVASAPTAPAPAAEVPPPIHSTVKQQLEDKAADGDAEFLQNVIKNNPDHPQIVAHAQQLLDGLAAQSTPPTQAPAPSLADKPAYVHIADAIDNGTFVSLEEEQNAVAAAAKDWLSANPEANEELKDALAALNHSAVAGKMGQRAGAAPSAATVAHASIDWAALTLPPTNVNAGSVNKKLAALKAATEAGDVAAIQAMKFGVNTYNKKLGAAQSKILAAMGAGPAQAAPVKVVSVAEAKPVAAPPAAAPAPKVVSAAEVKPAAAPPAQPTAEELKTIGAKMATWISAGKPKDAAMEALWATLSPAAQFKVEVAAEKSAKPQRVAKVAEVPTAPAVAAPTPQAVLLHNTKPGHNKFYSITIKGNEVHTHYGKIGAAGKKDVHTYSSEHHAHAQAKLLLNAKVKKGYEAQSGGLAATAAKPAGPKEGDTKQGADGMLVLKDGHWVKAHAAFTPKAAAAQSSDDGPLDISAWKQVGPQAGSNPGGVFESEDGTRYYCKFPSNTAHAHAEVLAAKLYELAGISAPISRIVKMNGKVGIASLMDPDLGHAVTTLKSGKVAALKSGFAADAWLGNRDVVGIDFHNVMLGKDGKPVRIDVGASLMFRAQGEPKEFHSKADEVESLLNPAINQQTAAAFKGITKADIAAGVAKLALISDDAIAAAVHGSGLGDKAYQDDLIKTLIARRADLLSRFPAAKKKATPKKKPFNPDKISAPPSFLDWGGSGKPGPSSHEFVNKSNHDAVQAIYAAAKTGKAGAVTAVDLPIFDKGSGAKTGTVKALSHPSQHVKGYAQQASNEVEYQLNPPKRFRFEGGHPLAALHSSYPAHKPGSAGAAKKVAKFLLAGTPGKATLEQLALPAKVTHKSGALTQATYSKAAQTAYAKMPETQRQAITSYTGSAYGGMNSSLWNGNPSGAAKAAGEALHTLGHTITPGTVLSRKINLHGDDLQAVLASTGNVLQEQAIMSTSIRPSSWGGNVHLKMHVGPGVKGLWVGKGSKPGGAISKHSSEDEMILPPNTRLMILSVKATKGVEDADGFGGPGVQHVIEAVILPTN